MGTRPQGLGEVGRGNQDQMEARGRNSSTPGHQDAPLRRTLLQYSRRGARGTLVRGGIVQSDIHFDISLIDTPLIDISLIDNPLIDISLINTPLIDIPLIDTPLIDIVILIVRGGQGGCGNRIISGSRG